MLSHVLANNPRVRYDHQTDLIGADRPIYTLLTLISNMLSQYNAWYNSHRPARPDDRRHRGPGPRPSSRPGPARPRPAPSR